MADTANTYNMPEEGWGYYLNQEEKEELARKRWEQYALERQNQRYIKRIVALVTSVLMAQEKGYLDYDARETEKQVGQSRDASQNQSKSSSTTLTQVSENKKTNLGCAQTILGDNPQGVDYTSELLRRAREFCGVKSVDGIPLFTGMRYVPEDREPKHKDGEVSEDTINRELIWAFKSPGDYDLKLVTNVREILSDFLSHALISCFAEYMMELVLIPVACSSRESTEIRWWRFMKIVVDKCEEQLYNIQNGFGLIQFLEDAPIPSHFNKGKAPQAKYTFKNLKGKNVVLVDDICASRNTLRRNIKMIKKAGGHVVACFVFADSNTKEV